MMHQNPTASRKFDAADVRVFATQGQNPEDDALVFYDPTDTTRNIGMKDPIDLREWR